MRWLGLGMLAVVLLAPAVVGSHGDYTETAPYLAGSFQNCPFTSVPNEPQACFDLNGHERRATITLSDNVVLWPVRGFYRLYSSSGTIMSTGSFCTTLTATWSSAADSLHVWLDPAAGLCGLAPGVGVMGTITANFDNS